MTGYSGTPLPRKLGVVEGVRLGLLHAPPGYAALLELPESAFITRLAGGFDWLQAFYTERAALAAEFAALKAHLSPAGQLWVSWPKQSAGVATDLNENIVREIGLHVGVVDVKVAAIDDTWSGLKFVYRLRDR